MHRNPCRLVPAAIALMVGGVALTGCTATPPDGVPMMRAVPAANAEAGAIDASRGAIVEFLPGDTIAMQFDLESPIGHLDGGPAESSVVIDRRFLVYSDGNRSSISFDDGATWTPAHRALIGDFDFGWVRSGPDGESGAVSEIRFGIRAEPR